MTEKRTSLPKSPAKKTRSRKEPSTKRTLVSVSAGERNRLIAEIAYFKAQARGFSPEDCMRDWLDAEQEVDSQYIVGP